MCKCEKDRSFLIFWKCTVCSSRCVINFEIQTMTNNALSALNQCHWSQQNLVNRKKIFLEAKIHDGTWRIVEFFRLCVCVSNIKPRNISLARTFLIRALQYLSLIASYKCSVKWWRVQTHFGCAFVFSSAIINKFHIFTQVSSIHILNMYSRTHPPWVMDSFVEETLCPTNNCSLFGRIIRVLRISVVKIISQLNKRTADWWATNAIHVK